MNKLVIIIAIATLVFFSPIFPAIATEPADKIFQANCAGCHANGGNIIRRGKNLKQRALRRNKMDSLEAVVSLVANGKNNMPAYSDRLSAKQIETVSTYVLKRASEDWR